LFQLLEGLFGDQFTGLEQQAVLLGVIVGKGLVRQLKFGYRNVLEPLIFKLL
jgi:hypothetical protein